MKKKCQLHSKSVLHGHKSDLEAAVTAVQTNRLSSNKAASSFI